MSSLIGSGRGMGASSETTELLSKAEAPTDLRPTGEYFSRGPAAQHPACAFYEWLLREYAEPNPEAGEAVTWIARPLMAALTRFCMAEGPFDEAPAFAAAMPSGGQWQPIETAPKDGELILVCGSGKHFGFALVSTGDDWLANVSAGAMAGWPSHWMPLSAPPSVSDEHPAGEDAIAAEGEACQRGGEAETPEANPPLPDPITAAQAVLEEKPQSMTLEEARDILQDYSDPRWWVDHCRRTGRYLEAADRIERAISTIQSHQEKTGEVRS